MDEFDRQIKSLERKLEKISTIEIHRATASAENKTIAKAKTATASLVGKETGVPVGVVKRRIYQRRAIVGRKNGRLDLYAKPVNAIEARPSRYRRGWKVAGQRHDGAFLARMRNQSRHHIFKRKGRDRLPIEKVTVQISEAVARVGRSVMEYHGRKVYPVILKREYSARINGYVKRRH